MKYKCKKCGTEFEVDYDVVCPKCGERWEVEPIHRFHVAVAGK